MRNIKRLMAVTMLAVFATLGAQTAKADGVLLSDRSGVLLSDNQSTTSIDGVDVLGVILRSLSGVMLMD